MKLSILPSLVSLTLCPVGHAATVLTNAGGTPGPSQLVKGPGGFISQPISFGVEFTTSFQPEPWIFESLSLTFTSASSSDPLIVGLYQSPNGPATATLVATLTGPAIPAAGLNTWTAPITISLTSNTTYFVKLSVTAGGGSYGVARTSDPATGDWTLGASHTQTGSAAWNPVTGTSMALSITAIPEPTSVPGLAMAGLALMHRRRRPVLFLVQDDRNSLAWPASS
jgi:hypothetical protein